MAIEPVLLTATRIMTYAGDQGLTNASGFFFRSARGLFLVTSRHVLIDEAEDHHPDRIEIELHTDANNATQSVNYAIPLYREQRSQWIQAADAAGDIDVAVIKIDSDALPDSAVYAAFTPAHLYRDLDLVEIGTSMLIIGFPLGFHDTLHHLPVARQAINASSFRLRFQGQGYFLTDARTHRGSSGAAVLIRDDSLGGDLPWRLVGVHSARFDVDSRDKAVDEALGLNCAWFADVLMPLTSGRDAKAAAD